jgi:alcohol dehydrogenase class IV
MPEQQVLSWKELACLPADGTQVWAIERLAPLASAALPFDLIADSALPAAGQARIVAIGGGAFLDRVKLWRRETSPQTWLCAVASLWGSGAEASPIAVRLENGQKVAHSNAALLPEARAVWPELASAIPANLACWGYGDTLSHAIEAFLSPLGGDDNRAIAADFLKTRLLPQALDQSPAWFDLSADACAIQARAGVGLVHGIAHTLEPQLADIGHARLCSAFLWPVFRYNVERGAKVGSLTAAYGIEVDRLDRACRAVFDATDFHALLPTLERLWDSVIRHPLSRINCTTARRDGIDFFRQTDFAA